MRYGFTLVEMAIGLAIFGVLLALALPNFTIFLQNAKIRNAAETTLQGLNLARAEGIRRNRWVRFQLVSDLSASCQLSGTALNWVVSLSDPTGQCNVPPSDTVSPQIIQMKSAGEGTNNVVVDTGGESVTGFNGLGRGPQSQQGTGSWQATSSITQFDFSYPSGGTCTHLDPTNGAMRCLRIVISPGGAIKLCDPKVTAATDPRKCS